ncbi:alpha-aminoadipate reductase [Pseudovirgaria hyperparasitica]|uniref:Alpha-aminoadipate reductase n=1 Tax=Pseudovirgaria hyperparasitica TaxID=470096 RepID=A0A6A6VXI7_9PEZI|nr:alpha-aminoadipate reductase [Pseudovirgaria hyperparasitica]KAF2753977.1 alpha-aminoadipate reductase [Pseudovirgaria hyperparasitica]
MSAALPDPTADLHWSSYRGAIHEIFAANAKKHPERPCVIETATSSTPRREFTYRHIFEASCQLAHKLTSSGVQRGEVVMIYAHRSVHLCVAILGTLMSGATFSVLDPLYPPDRQIIYLDVSRPRALVILEKATEEAGPLTEKVRDFIDTTLQLRVEVPALKIVDDGTLLGGMVDGRDCLEEQALLKSDMPGVVVGPDSTPTLSFTSGSEGRPKGVKGRHFSLAYYFDWMSEQFKLTENDAFTMLSGIAHDPIQRDIFTPLFLGARLLVPSKDDIQHERLAEWMRREGANVTHLTPAMGQILVGGTMTQFPTLHHAFFVGDILIKRDCRRLQELAPNVCIVNMYGTTETQRAVSYFEIPSVTSEPAFLESIGDVIPAGRGMKDVQMLIIDREDKNRLCDVGETGEIYVRAGGLAEGYLGLDEATKEKFVPNWFVDPQKWIDEDTERVQQQGHSEPWREFYKGPRDRMYRSGDLGRRKEDGNVECTGRVDNQVKIRGFRIELGEIDKHLSSHQLVRENVTLLRRDANEEPTLVSYIVPDMGRWNTWVESKENDRGLTVPQTDESMLGMLQRFWSLTRDVREHLKTKLPDYAIPSVFVPLYRFPLNPNGKIDKPALPYPGTDDLASAAPRRISRRFSHTSSSLSATEKEVAKLWAESIRTVRADSLEPDSNFWDLGGHSIIAQNLTSTARKRFEVDVGMRTIIQHPTLREFSREIDRARDPTGLQLYPNDELSKVNFLDENYSADAAELAHKLPKVFGSVSLDPSAATTVFLTGATGFLGAYILLDVLQRPSTSVIAHVRAKDPSLGLERIKKQCSAYGIWDDTWQSRIKCVVGDLSEPNLGLEDQVWDSLSKEVDVIIHNGAQVHWIHLYSTLRKANVLSTLALVQLCAIGKPKQFGFVSSTSVLDTDYYVSLSESDTAFGAAGVSESDNLWGSRKGLTTGYGQSKWASEFIVRQAGRRGLRGCIIRPGYVSGHPISGTTNTDDFLVRFLKGCVQTTLYPDIQNTINQTPVDHVARTVVAATLNPPTVPLGVAQVTAHPRLSIQEFGACLAVYGYDVKKTDYDNWRKGVERYVETTEIANREEHALLPLYEMVTTNMPEGTKAPELDDINASAALRADAQWTGQDLSAGAAVTADTVGVYLAYLVAIGFMKPPPDDKGQPLPPITINDQQRAALAGIGGRGRKV